MLMLLVSTNVSEMLSAHLKLLLDLLLFLAPKELNADVEILIWNALLELQLLLVSILKITCHTPLEPPLELLEPPELLELLESQLLPQFPLFNLLTKMLFADHTDGIVLTSLKEILLTLALMIHAVELEMEVIVSGILILMLDLVLEMNIVLMLVVATLPLIVEIPITGSAQSTVAVELVEFVSLYALNKNFISIYDG